ncbi:UNVERIFIED_CONTAM: hypothetical protein K2H54_033810 [Gekko kuhli]
MGGVTEAFPYQKIDMMGPEDDPETLLNTFTPELAKSHWAMIMTPHLAGPVKELADSLRGEEAAACVKGGGTMVPMKTKRDALERAVVDGKAVMALVDTGSGQMMTRETLRTQGQRMDFVGPLKRLAGSYPHLYFGGGRLCYPQPRGHSPVEYHLRGHSMGIVSHLYCDGVPEGSGVQPMT